MIGTTLDKYSVLQKVGEGGMATVYRGRHATLDRDVAIKVLHPHLSSSARMRKRFEREAQAIEHLRHDNILQIYDYSGLEGYDCYIVTEFVEGHTLSGLLQRRGRIPSEVAALMGVSLCKALAYAHDCGVLHRDIKPDNVMVRVDGTVKLMDFGIARFLDETRVTMTGALVGSPAFMSPEQAREAKLDQRSDLFSLGTVLFNLVTGSLPFTGGNPSLILKKVIEGTRPAVAELAPALSPTLGDAIERLLSTAPEDRFNHASEVEQQLLVVLREAGIDPAEPRWSLVRWLDEPDDYEAVLQAHLREHLVAEGRRLLAANDHLAALRQLNRVLSMDEDNPEVLALIQNLHKEPRTLAGAPPRVRAAGLGAGAFLLIGAAALAWLGVNREGGRAPVEEGAEASGEAAPVARLPGDPSVPRTSPAPQAAPDPDASPPGAPALPAGGNPAPAPPADPRATAEPPGARAFRPPREPPREPLPAPPPVEDQTATIRLNTQKNMADVYLGGKRMGSSREPLVVRPGTHVLLLRHRLFEDQKVEVTVSPGEERVVEVSLRPRPSKVTFSESWPDACLVRANGAEVGSLASLGRALPVEAPDRPLKVELGCPDGRGRASDWAVVPPPSVRFPGPP